MEKIEVGAFFFFMAIMVLFCFGLNYVAHKRGIRKKYLIGSFFILTIVIGARCIEPGFGGSDAYGYALRFFSMTEPQFIDRFSEVLFLVYTYFIRCFTDNTLVYFMITAGVMTGTYIKFIHYFYEKRKYAVCLFLYWPVFLYLSFTALRNGMAVAICLIAYIFLEKRMYAKALLISLIAFFFHYSALIFIIFILFNRAFEYARVFKINRIVFITISIVILLASLPLIQKIFVESRYAFLADKVHASILGALPYYVIGFFTLINHRKIFPQTGNPVWMYAVYFLCIIYPVCAYFGLYRFPYYFIPALCIASSDICRYYSGRITKNSIGLYSIVVCLIFMGYGGLRLVSIGRTSSILFYKLWFL